jgi:hypothetical protein
MPPNTLMPFSTAIKKQISKAPDGPGKLLGTHAIRLDFSVLRIAKATGATRQTVYNWLAGGPIAPYYKQRFTQLTDILSAAKTAEHAWRDACSRFNLKT